MTTLASVLPYACLGLLAVGLFGFVESLPFWAPRESLAERLRQLEPEYWAHLAQAQHSAALRPVRVGHSIMRPVVDELADTCKQCWHASVSSARPISSNGSIWCGLAFRPPSTSGRRWCWD